MEWWNDIWLNEGFARYMEYISVEATYPELKVVCVWFHMSFNGLIDQYLDWGWELVLIHVLCSTLQEEYLLHTCFAAVGHDSLNSSRPISSAAENPTQIKEMFDTVSYDKVSFPHTEIYSNTVTVFSLTYGITYFVFMIKITIFLCPTREHVSCTCFATFWQTTCFRVG